MSQQEERLQAYRRTITIISIVIVLYLSFLIIRPFLVAIAGAAVLAYLFYPVYKYFRKIAPSKKFKESIAAIITVLLIILIVLIPMAIITGLLANEARSGYLYLQTVLRRPDITIELPPFISERIGDISNYVQPLVNIASQFIGWVQRMVISIPGTFLNIFITIFSIYFFLKGGSNIYNFLQDFFPLPTGRYKQIFSRTDDLIRGILLGQIVVGIIHGFLAWGAYSFLGVASPVLWAFITAIISILPVLGAGLVWFPIAVYLFISGLVLGTYWKGIALLIYGLFVMTAIDNVLKPKIMGESSRIHPLIILFGILGGIQFLGLPGIIIGPMILALFDVMLGIFREVI
jgi:predicted PurR-regulated permease PerM